MAAAELEDIYPIFDDQILSVSELHPWVIVEEVTLHMYDPTSPAVRQVGVVALNYNFLRINEDWTVFDDNDARTFVGAVELGDEARTVVAEVFYLADVGLEAPFDGEDQIVRYLRYPQAGEIIESSDPPRLAPV